MATLTPVAIDVDAGAWRAAVAAAVDRWSIELANVQCPITPFVIGDAGHEVRGWKIERWPFETHWLGATHVGADESIDVVADLEAVHLHNTLLHELGHAMGLGHRTDQPSLMNPDGGELVPDDVADACTVLELEL